MQGGHSTIATTAVAVSLIIVAVPITTTIAIVVLAVVTVLTAAVPAKLIVTSLEASCCLVDHFCGK